MKKVILSALAVVFAFNIASGPTRLSLFTIFTVISRL